MNIELPLYGQEKFNTCALACLRMVLAAYGTHVEESALESHARMEVDGIRIDELERLARQYNLVAEIQDTTVEEFQEILAAGKLAIAFLDRAVFDLTPVKRTKHRLRDARMHTVIPVRVTSGSVTFYDPRPPKITRKTFRLFRHAYDGLGGVSVVCSKPLGE